ncbi:MAG: hypothetical protein LBO67_04915 [Spirochaetaceae bacterium]|jgi:hypothetical protein|nr:hypothetical protein [Spirochaetaceae bacterium]
MTKQKAIPNQYDGPQSLVDTYETKYFKYLQSLPETSEDFIAAFGSHDIQKIKLAIKNISNSINNHVLLIGLACVIIDREQLYIDAGYKSYLDFVKVLYEETGLSPQSFSAAKIIVERFIDHNSELKKYGFTIDRNTNKLLFLETALANHANKADVFKHIAQDKYVDFVAYSKTPDGQKVLPPPQPKIKLEKGKILIDGINILNFPDTLPEPEKERLGKYLSEVYAIRAAGNEPLIVETYDEHEAKTLKNRIASLLKRIRANR